MNERPSLLLHVCCGPCTTAVLERLVGDYEVTCLWYNPNIQPGEEWQRRLETARQVAEHYGVELLGGEAEDPEAWRAAVAGLEGQPEGGERCRRCYRVRLAWTAQEAVRLGIGQVATTLSISPHKSAQAINSVGREVSQRAGCGFLAADFGKSGGFGRSVELSRALGLYRQRYCGCGDTVALGPRGATGSLGPRA